MPLDLAVLESRWWQESNSSVRGLFDLLADIHKDNPSAYHYEMFNNKDSLKEIIRRVAKKKQNIYIAAHANNKAIEAAGGDIPRKMFRDILRELITATRVRHRGLFVGSCLFVNKENAKYLLKNHNGKRVKVRWIAGYSKEIDWIDSTAVDLYFWHNYLLSYDKFAKKTNYTYQTIHQTVLAVSKQMREFMPGAYNELGFNIFVRKQGRGGGVETLPPVE